MRALIRGFAPLLVVSLTACTGAKQTSAIKGTGALIPTKGLGASKSGATAIEAIKGRVH